MSKTLDLLDFLDAPGTILDVRSPGEHAQGRIPGAFNLPLFSNEERSIVGTTYKQIGKKEALLRGLSIVGPKLADFVRHAETILKDGFAKVHCWRGGMRSSSMAWLLETGGFKTVSLKGGYKAFRKWALQEIVKPKKICVIGGMTGSGKTDILKALKEQGNQVLDLELLAAHRGSSFGNIGMPRQASNEQFENEIAMQWFKFDAQKPVWIEDESRLIGACKIPDGIFNAMRNAPLFLIDRPLEERLERLSRVYWSAEKRELIDGIRRLEKRLGGSRTKEIIKLIESGDLENATLLTLEYYDEAYLHGMQKRKEKATLIQGVGLSDAEWAMECTGKVHF